MLLKRYPHKTVRQVCSLRPQNIASLLNGMPLGVKTIGLLLSDSKLNATESPKLFATEKKSRDIIVLLLE
jgi:hypothetical protein